MTQHRAFVAVVLAAFLSAPLTEAQERPLFSSSAELVVLHVTVKDRRGAYVNRLPQQAFTVWEENHPKEIRFFTGEDAPVTVGLLVDSSGSMYPSRQRVISAITAFADASNRQDEIFALTFNEYVRAVLPKDAPFTGESTVLREAVSRNLTARGRTALYDAIVAGLEYLERGRHERKVLVVVSDGADNESATAFPELLLRTQASNVLIYTVAIVDPIERDANPKLLKRIAEATGGEAFSPKHVDQVMEVLQKIANDIRNSYTLGYVPAARDGAFHRVAVAVDAPGVRSVVVRTRTGYLAGTPIVTEP